MIDGLKYITDFISEEEESDLLNQIDNQEWCLDLKRRVQHYGYKYDYTKKKINESMRVGEIPAFLNKYKELVSVFFEKSPDQIIINEYRPGQGISPHVDCIPCFGPVVASLSLGSPVLMEFKNRNDKTDYQLDLLPGSLLVLKDEARYSWTHGIKNQKTQEEYLLHLERLFYEMQ
jgi:alkylated DNA repair dioxygenase AlkB